MGRHAVNSNQVFYDEMVVPAECRIGEEGRGFRYILDSLNPERILNAAEVVGMGRRALEKAVAYADERVVFGRKIGQNQPIQHPLAECWSELYAAELMTLHAAELYDAGEACGAQANAAKYLAADAGFRACDRAIRTHGGMGYAAEYHVERYFREMVATQLAPVSREMILLLHRRTRARPAEIVLGRSRIGLTSYWEGHADGRGQTRPSHREARPRAVDLDRPRGEAQCDEQRRRCASRPPCAQQRPIRRSAPSC